MPKHSPGPWFSVGPIVRTENKGIELAFGDSKEICDCRSIWTKTGDPNIQVPESEANARLIAAAPDLFNALKVVIECIDKSKFPTIYREIVLLTGKVERIVK